MQAAERTVSTCLAGCMAWEAGGQMEGLLLGSPGLWDDPPEATPQSTGCLWPSVGFESCLPSSSTSLKRKGKLKQKQNTWKSI